MPENSSLPLTPDALRTAAEAFSADLASAKARFEVPDYGWYPYPTMTALPAIAALFAPVYGELREALGAHPVADIGCGDGDLGLFFARLGAAVDAIDHAETNFNQMRGVEILRRSFAVDLSVHDLDLDRPFALPRRDYSLALFLGTLYHLKNPLYVLETIAVHADWCVLSTRIAQVTCPGGTRIEEEPLAYLLGAREANNDPTNFWIFSMTGLLRLLERSGWMVMGHARLGSRTASDPVNPQADERALVVAKSRIRHPGLYVRPLEGWHPAEDDAFRWTAKRFSLDVRPPERAHEFALRIFVPEIALASGAVRLTCSIAGQPAGAIACDTSDPIEFRGRFPFEAPAYQLDFTVAGNFHPPGDARELGVCVPLLDARERHTNRIPFRIS